MSATTLKSFLRGLRVGRVDIVPAGDDPEARIQIAKRHEDDIMTDTIPEHLAELADLSADDVASIAKYVDDLAAEASVRAAEIEKRDAEIERLAAEIAKLDTSDDDVDDDDVLKGAPPEVVERIEKAEAAAADAVEKARALELRERQTIFKSRAQSMPRIGDADSFGELLRKAADSLDDDDYNELERLFVAADERLAKSALTIEQGKGAGVPSSVADEARGRADDLVKIKPDLTPSQALTEVLKADPSLYERYNAEKQSN